MNSALDRVRRASVGTLAVLAALAAALAAGCQTQSPVDKGEQRPPTAPAEAPPESQPSGPGPGNRPAEKPVQPARSPEPLPPALSTRSVGTFTPASWLTGAERVLGFRHGNKPFIVAAGTGWLRVHSPDGAVVVENRERGAAQVLTRLPDAAPAVTTFAVGRGISREDMTAPMSVTVFRFDGRALESQPVALPATTRTQVVAIAQRAPESPVWLTVFESKYQALLLQADRNADGTFTATAHKERIRVPLGMAIGDPDGDGQDDIFIARPYGDGQDEPGDVFRWRADGGRELLPTTRGARAVAVVGESVLVADGWHKDYGRRANALITRIVPADGGEWRATRLVHVAGRHGYDGLHVGYIDGDDAIDLVASGNGPAVLVSGLAPVTDQVPTLGDVEARDVAIAPISRGSDDNRRMDVIIAGKNPGIWRLDD